MLNLKSLYSHGRQLCLQSFVLHFHSFVFFFFGGGNLLPFIVDPKHKSDSCDVFCPILWCYHCVSMGEWQRYLCTVCEFRLTAKIKLCCIVWMELWRKSRIPSIILHLSLCTVSFSLLCPASFFFLYFLCRGDYQDNVVKFLVCVFKPSH